mgnify:CR=1 FL=1
MKTILAYGDSLTYGSDAVVQGRRHAYEDRWPTRLEVGLGGKARVIAEGLGPLDAVAIMLGTNDMKSFVCGSALGASRGIKRLGEIVRAEAPQAQLLLISPPHCIEPASPPLDPRFSETIAESRQLAHHYQRVADELGCQFFDAATVAKADPSVRTGAASRPRLCCARPKSTATWIMPRTTG